jgi:hypothetical protein
MPAELQAIHRYVVETPVLKNVTEEIRAAVETVSVVRDFETGGILI